MNYLEKTKAKRPKLAERDRGGDRIEAQCPCCGTFRPAFCVHEITGALATALGTSWACDGCISHFNRQQNGS